MPKRTNAFQQLVHFITRNLNASAADIQESRELTDKITGLRREVDIVVERIDDVHSVIIGVECRGGGESSRPATVEWVERMHGKHEGLTDKLVLVAKGGFTVSAIKKAEHWRIQTMTLDQAGSFDWSSLHKMERINFCAIVPRLVGVSIVLGKEHLGVDITTIDENNPVIHVADGSENRRALEWVKEVVNNRQVTQHIRQEMADDEQATYDIGVDLPDDAYILDRGGERRRITSLIAKFDYSRHRNAAVVEKYAYGQIAVLRATGQTANSSVEMVATQRPGEEAMATYRVTYNKQPELTPSPSQEDN